MKPADRLLKNANLFKFMAVFWTCIPVALAAVFWVFPRATGPAEFHRWAAIARAASTLANTLLALLVIAIGGKLLVSLFQIARNDPDRISRAVPWLFESRDVAEAKQKVVSGKPSV